MKSGPHLSHTTRESPYRAMKTRCNQREHKNKQKSTYNSIRNNKYLGINLIKEVKGMYNENCMRLMKETEDTSGEIISCSWIRRVNIKMSILSKIIYRFNVRK